jgi:hypothetical protein
MIRIVDEQKGGLEALRSHVNDLKDRLAHALSALREALLMRERISVGSATRAAGEHDDSAYNIDSSMSLADMIKRLRALQGLLPGAGASRERTVGGDARMPAFDGSVFHRRRTS